MRHTPNQLAGKDCRHKMGESFLPNVFLTISVLGIPARNRSIRGSSSSFGSNPLSLAADARGVHAFYMCSLPFSRCVAPETMGLFLRCSMRVCIT
jgi:hypothetical protein